MKRIAEVDALRGIAIILMVIYHFFFDLDYFGISDISLYDTPWVLFQRVIGTLFLGIAGISLVLSEQRSKGYGNHAKRALKLAGVAALITIATWIYPHQGFIKFGIIHMIALSTLIAPFFFRLGWMNVVLGLIMIVAGLEVHHTDIDYVYWLGWTRYDYQALDHYPLIPWFGVILMGIYAGQRIYPEGKPRFKINFGPLAMAGRHSLTIYLLHQPILIGALLLFN